MKSPFWRSKCDLCSILMITLFPVLLTFLLRNQVTLRVYTQRNPLPKVQSRRLSSDTVVRNIQSPMPTFYSSLSYLSSRYKKSSLILRTYHNRSDFDEVPIDLEPYAYNLLEFHDVAFDHFCTFGEIPILYAPREICQSTGKGYSELSAGSYLGEYYSVIGICHSSTQVFGHLMVDLCQFLSVLPQSLLLNSHILIHELTPATKDMLAVLGIPENKVVINRYRSYGFARRYYSFIPLPCNSVYDTGTVTLRRLLVKYYNLDESPPDTYAISNRDKLSRNITNLDEVVKVAKEVLPGIKWEVPRDFSTLSDSVRYFNRLRLIIMPHGSGVANCIVMQKGTVVIEIQPKNEFGFYFQYLCSVQVRLIFYSDPNMPHFEKPRAGVNVDVIKRMVMKAKDLLEL